ncbi:MAG TPA: zinc-dependent metalloprotease [Bacteroidia bacterium]|jgi:hypothetical protein|nr:zinc-dependent metalloprotease [Bacteroidia bacterium]
MIKKVYLSATFLLSASLMAVGQIGSTKNIGSASDWAQSINNILATAAKGKEATPFSIPSSNGNNLPVLVNMKSAENGTFAIGGGDAEKGTFRLSTDATGKVSGFYHSLKERKAYKYSTDHTGNVIATEVAIESILCMDYERALPIPSDEAEAASRPARTSAIPKFQSKPDSKYVIYIDLDGESGSSTWGNINAQPLQAWTDAEVLEIWQVAAQDYLTWDVNVTTDRSVYDAQPLSRKMMCIVTSTLDAANGQAIGGIAHIGSFGSGSYDPCWVYNKGVKVTGETVSHEVGHTVGLNHDGKGSAVYYQGHNSWAPIMGAVYSTSAIKIDNPNALGHWSKGEYSGATNTENDLSIIGTSNGFSPRADEHANTANSSATALAVELDGKVMGTKNYGIINTAADLDVFKFTIKAGDLNLVIVPYYNTTDLIRYPNLNIKARLLNSSGTALATVDSLPPTDFNTWGAMTATVKVAGLAAGTYYLEIDGTKQGSSPSVGYSDYCSIGGFNISGTLPEPMGLIEQEKISQFNIFPNPSSGIFSVTFNSDEKSNYKLSVLNTLGQVVYEEALNGFSGAYSKELHLNQYGKGVFMINIADEVSSSTRRVVVY